MIKLRLFRALALATMIAFGWGGVAAAQTQAADGYYNFTFTDGQGINASGLLHVASGIITSISGTSTSLADRTPLTITGLIAPGGFQPAYTAATNDNALFSTNPQLTDGGFAFLTSGESQGINYTAGPGYSLTDSNGNTSDSPDGSFQTTPAAAGAAAPVPGGSLLSWIIAAVGGSGVGLRRLILKRRRAPTTTDGDLPTPAGAI